MCASKVPLDLVVLTFTRIVLCHGNTASPDDDSTVQESTIIFSPLPRQEGIFRLTDYVEANEKDWDLGFHALIAGAFTEALAEMNWGKYC